MMRYETAPRGAVSASTTKPPIARQRPLLAPYSRAQGEKNGVRYGNRSVTTSGKWSDG